MAEKNRGQERNIGQNRGQEQQQDRDLNQGRKNVSNTQTPQTQKTSSGLGQQQGSQQRGNLSEGGMGYGRSGEPDSGLQREESEGGRESGL